MNDFACRVWESRGRNDAVVGGGGSSKEDGWRLGSYVACDVGDVGAGSVLVADGHGKERRMRVLRTVILTGKGQSSVITRFP